MGNTILQSASDHEPRGALVQIPEDACLFEGALTKSVRDQTVNDLMRILERLDALELWRAGAHLSSAIESIQNEAVVDRASPEA